MLNFSIHTFELRLETKTSEICKIRDWLYSNNIPIRKYGNDILNILTYANEGVRIRFVPDNYIPYFSFIVNLREVFDNGNLVDLIDPLDVDLALEQVNHMIEAFLGEGYDINTLKLCRIDCCVNVDTGSQEAVNAYLKMFNYKSGGKGYNIKNINSPKGYCQNEFRAENRNGDIALSIYNKMAQLISIKRKSEAARAEGIMRVEVQLKRNSAITKLISRELSNSDIIRETVLNSHNIITDVLFSVLYPGSYLKLKDAIKFVNLNVKKQKLRQRMIRLLELTAMKHSTTLARDVIFSEDKKLSKNYYQKMIIEFHKLNLNVVTLGRRSRFGYLKGLDELFYNK